MLRISISLALAVTAAAFVGCGGSGSSSNSPPSVPMSDVPAKLATELCKVANKCYGPLFGVMSVDDCQTLYQNQYAQGDFAATQSEINAKRVSYDGTKVDACLQAIDALGCSSLSSRTPDSCRSVFPGTVATGGNCTITADCKSASDVCLFGSSCPGKCQPRVAAGAACHVDDDCQNGLICNAKKCIQPASEGAACGLAGQPPCMGGLFCEGANAKTKTAGACKQVSQVFTAASGAKCDFLHGPLCVTGQSCEVSVSGTTVTQKCVGPVAAGGTCHLARPEECPSGQYCKVAKLGAAGTCTPLPTDGQPCAARVNGPPCAANNRCDTSTKKCVTLKNDGASCSAANVCYSQHCMSNKCEPGVCSTSS